MRGVRGGVEVEGLRLENRTLRLIRLRFGKQKQRSGKRQLLKQKKSWKSFRTRAGIINLF